MSIQSNFEKSQAAKILASYGIESNDLEKGGEGSKGGKIIGHTRTGKAIYENANHKEHKSFTKEDHKDAVNSHLNHANVAINAVLQGDKSQEAVFQNHHDQIAKHKEKIAPKSSKEQRAPVKLGTTQSGKDIYDDSTESIKYGGQQGPWSEGRKEYNSQDFHDAMKAHHAKIDEHVKGQEDAKKNNDVESFKHHRAEAKHHQEIADMHAKTRDLAAYSEENHGNEPHYKG